jgi:ketosteroid isomerase-like protein
MKYAGVVLLLSVLGLSSPTFAQDTGAAAKATEAQIKDIMARWMKAEPARDKAFFEKVLGDELVAGTNLGDFLSKKQLIDRITSPGRVMTELQIDNVKVMVYGDVALQTDHTVVHGTLDGKPFGGVFRYLRVFVKRNGNWQVVLLQGTPLKPPTT